MAKAKAAKKIVEPPADFGDYLIVNHEKLDRVINGVAGTDYRGLGQDASPEAILAEYDRLGGLILLRDGGVEVDEETGDEKRINVKVATGSFYDFKAKAPRGQPQIKKVVKRTSGPKLSTELVGDDEVPKKKKSRSPADDKD